MKIKYIIPSIGDSNSSSSASHLVRIDRRTRSQYVDFDSNGVRRNRMNRYGEIVTKLSVSHVQEMGVDPVLEAMCKTVQNKLFPMKSLDNKSNFMNNIGFKYSDYEFDLFFGRSNNRYFLNGRNMNKGEVIRSISKIIIRSSLTMSGEQLIRYAERVMDFPHNVLYALENRTPYHFSVDFRKTEVVINTRLISDKEVVLEISDSVWGVMTLKELNTFIEYFKHGRRRSKKWIDIPLENLWTELMGSPPSRTELEKMKQWLLQHRTQDLVEDRATKLLFDIDAESPSIRFVQFKNPANKALFVRGKYADWVIAYTGVGMKRGRQDVKTYKIGNVLGENKSRQSWHGHELSGSICIDNVSKGASIGDQLTARALALVNEDVAAKHLYTITPFITEKIRSGEETYPRLDMSKLNDWSHRSANKYLAKKEEERRNK